jgi:acetolactate synthase-1/2/3 large subunit
MQSPGNEAGDAIMAAMHAGGAEYLFFTSGSEIAFFQEANAKARAEGRPTLKLITVPHEHIGLNAALGYAAVTGKPAVTAVHVDCGTQHYGGAVHTAWRSGLPVLITAGAPPTAYAGSMRGARDDGGHLWLQQTFDQNGIVRQYTKWDHKLAWQDNAGLIVSRALQVTRTEPCGPVYLSLPREITLLPAEGVRFPTAEQLGIPRLPLPDPAAIEEIAERLLRARNPFVVVSGSGRNPATVPALVELCELLGLAVIESSRGSSYLCFPMTHPLWQPPASIADADAVLVLDVDVPWVPGRNSPDDAYIAVVGLDPIKHRIPIYEFTADVRVVTDPLQAIRALTAVAKQRLGNGDKQRISDRIAKWGAASKANRERIAQNALSKANTTPIDPAWVGHQVAKALDDNCIVFDDTLPGNRLTDHLQCSGPSSYFCNPGSSGGWAPGAALGAKFGAPDRDVVAITGDGFYMFGTPTPALWTARHYGAPFLTVVYTNRSYSTGTTRLTALFPESHTQRSGFEGGYFDPPIDFAKEAEAAGAYGENVREPGDLEGALQRGREQVRNGKPAVISIWMKRLLGDD